MRAKQLHAVILRSAATKDLFSFLSPRAVGSGLVILRLARGASSLRKVTEWRSLAVRASRFTEIIRILFFAAGQQPLDCENQSPRLLDRVRIALRTKHYSLRTEQAYVAWIKRFIFFHGKRHPQEMAEPEINRFLSDLAVNGHVSASTQNQALSALLFLYRRVLEREFPDLDDLVRAKRPHRLPVVLTRAEVKSLLSHLSGTPRLVCTLLYGTGMR